MKYILFLLLIINLIFISISKFKFKFIKLNNYYIPYDINFEPFSGFISDADFQPDGTNKCLPDVDSVFYNGNEYNSV